MTFGTLIMAFISTLASNINETQPKHLRTDESKEIKVKGWSILIEVNDIIFIFKLTFTIKNDSFH